MKIVNIHEAKTTLSELIRSAEQGEEVVIARCGVPVVRLVAIEPAVKRVPGLWRTLPGWENFVLDPAVVAPLTDEQIADKGGRFDLFGAAPSATQCREAAHGARALHPCNSRPCYKRLRFGQRVWSIETMH